MKVFLNPGHDTKYDSGAAMSGDTDTMTAIKDELAALNEKYDADYAALDK